MQAHAHADARPCAQIKRGPHSICTHVSHAHVHNTRARAPDVHTTVTHTFVCMHAHKNTLSPGRRLLPTLLNALLEGEPL